MALSITDSGILTPSPSKEATTSNYTDIVTFGADKLLPDYYSNLVERFGNQTIQGFLSKTSMEFPLKSDLIEWHEEGRIALYYTNLTYTTADNKITIKSGETALAFRVGQTVLVGDTSGNENVGYVEDVAADGADADVHFYEDTVSLVATADAVYARLIGSEFEKGQAGMVGTLETETTNFSNAPSIMKDKYSVSGSDAAQIGWIEVSGGAESTSFGANGWLWYLKSEMDNRERFMDTLETQSLEIKKVGSSSEADTLFGTGASRGKQEGVFAALNARGIISTGTWAVDTFANWVADADKILKELDKQGNVQENLLYLDRDESLAVDNGLALANGAFSGGSYFGAFSNSSDMALNLGFKSWHRGSYTFHKTDWKYLNDLTGRSTFGTSAAGSNIKGVLTPSGSMSVYDQSLGGTAKRPYIHVRYRASQTDNRKLKHWLTGSVGAKPVDDNDRMDVHYLSERCTVVQGANNFVLFKR